MGTPLIWINTFLSVLTVILWSSFNESSWVIICFVAVSCILGFINEFLTRRKYNKLIDDIRNDNATKANIVNNIVDSIFDDVPFDNDENT